MEKFEYALYFVAIAVAMVVAIVSLHETEKTKKKLYTVSKQSDLLLDELVKQIAVRYRSTIPEASSDTKLKVELDQCAKAYVWVDQTLRNTIFSVHDEQNTFQYDGKVFSKLNSLIPRRYYAISSVEDYCLKLAKKDLREKYSGVPFVDESFNWKN